MVKKINFKSLLKALEEYEEKEMNERKIQEMISAYFVMHFKGI